MRGPEDERLAERALRKRWSVPDDKRSALIDMLVELALGDKIKPRQRITAVKTLLMAETLDLKAIEVAIKAETHDELVGRIEALEQEHDSPPRLPPRAQPPQGIWENEHLGIPYHPSRGEPPAASGAPV